jgi:hypothetical protein
MSMNVLLRDPLDANVAAAAGQKWDRIVDLGIAGAHTYARWMDQFRCPVVTLNSFRKGLDDLRQIRDLLSLGCGRLVDEHGLDWWEMLSILLSENLEIVILLKRLFEWLASTDEVYVSRPGLHATILQFLIPGRVQILSARKTRNRNLAHYVRVSRKLSASQMIDVFWDKCDPGYQFRGRFSREREPAKAPVVLLPTAYVNVSRTCLAYANNLPSENFLMVATRRSGRVKGLPINVSTAWLSSYASVQNRDMEAEAMRKRWRALLKDLLKVEEFRILNQLQAFDGFSKRFRHGLEVRDAWLNVFETERVQGVLCADDSNPYTRIPLLLARERGMPNIACHHGALDGRYIFKRRLGNVVLAKGKMEQDYLVRQCGVPAGRVEIGAPALPPKESKRWNPNVFRPYILFISEAYEVGHGRTEEFYRDVVPPLADLALSTGRKLIVKLHPAESSRERASIVSRILTPAQKSATRIVDGPLTDDLLDETWFGITVLSTVATECAIRAIPCFLCKWLEFTFYGYVDQFVRFGVGLGLDGPDEIMKIPKYLERYAADPGVADNCLQTIAPERLKQLLTRQASLQPSIEVPCQAAS